MDIGQLLAAFVRVYALMVLGRALFSWLPRAPRRNALHEFLIAATEPVLRPVRRALPSSGGMDFSPLLVLFLLEMIARALH